MSTWCASGAEAVPAPQLGRGRARRRARSPRRCRTRCRSGDGGGRRGSGRRPAGPSRERPQGARAAKEVDRAIGRREARARGSALARPVEELDGREAALQRGDGVEHRLPLRRHAGARRQREPVVWVACGTLIENDSHCQIAARRCFRRTGIQQDGVSAPRPAHLGFTARPRPGRGAGPAAPGATASAWAIRAIVPGRARRQHAERQLPPDAPPVRGGVRVSRGRLDRRSAQSTTATATSGVGERSGEGGESTTSRSSGVRSPPDASPLAPRRHRLVGRGREHWQ